jgi:UDP-N-acetyl-D-glucosamine dehydrogenase
VRVLVVGLGYVGLSLAVESAKAGLETFGFDIDIKKLNLLKTGKSPVETVSNSDLKYCIQKEQLILVEEINDSEKFDVICLCLPTPLDNKRIPDLSFLIDGVKIISRLNLNQTLIINESTSYPGTTEEVILPIIEESGLVVGRDFYLAFSPERVDPGNSQFNLNNTPKVISGSDDKSIILAKEYYSKFVREIIVSSGIKEAEMSKLLENTYRHVNIALVNELAQFCNKLGVDVWEVIRLASTKPFGFHSFYPGPGVGGHCIPIDPNYLSYRVRSQLGYPFKLVELAEEINQSMPFYVVERITQLLTSLDKSVKNSSILVLGVSYKADIGDLRESPAITIIDNLISRGAYIHFYDPKILKIDIEDLVISRVPIEHVNDLEVDLIVILQSFTDIDEVLAILSKKGTPIFDTKSVNNKEYNIYKL